MWKYGRLTKNLNFMNKNHYDPLKIYPAKIERLQACLHEVQEAQAILDQLPEDAVQRLWVKAIEAAFPASQKTKPIGKGLVKRSIRKTLQGLKVEQVKMLTEVQARLAEVDLNAQKNEEAIMDKLRKFVNSCKQNEAEKAQSDE